MNREFFELGKILVVDFKSYKTSKMKNSSQFKKNESSDGTTLN